MISQEERFLRILFPARTRVGPWLLAPSLTVGHLLLLRRLRNPFGQVVPLEEIEAGRADVAEAVTVLSMGWREAWELFSGAHPWRLRWALWRRTTANYLLAAARAMAVSDYIQAAFSRPSTIARSDGGKRKATPPLQAPYWLVMVHRLIDAGHTLGEVLDMPVSLVLWKAAAADEDRGVLVWCSEAEEAVQNQVRDEIAKAQAAFVNQ